MNTSQERTHNTYLDRMEDEEDRRNEVFARNVEQRIDANWRDMAYGFDKAERLIRDYQANPEAELAEIYRELAKMKAGLVCFEDAARIVFRNIERRIDDISRTQEEEE